MKVRALLVLVTLLGFALLAGSTAEAAPKVLKRYAHSQSKRIAKERCRREANCRSAAITECVRSHRSLVQCVVYVRLKPSAQRSYCTYRIGVEYRGQTLYYWRTRPVCA